MKKGKLIVISGPSGVGKGTVREKMKFKDYVFSISSTTRKKREGETEGKDYYFLTKDEFQKKIADGKMLEYAEFVDNYYGTDKKTVLTQLEQGKNVLLEIECQGAMQVINQMEDLISIFIIPPSLEELKCRLEKRATEDKEKIQKRLIKAEQELQLQDKYQYIIKNTAVDQAAREIDDILFSIIKDSNEN